MVLVDIPLWPVQKGGSPEFWNLAGFLLFLFFPAQDSAHGVVPPIFKVGLPSSVKYLWEHTGAMTRSEVYRIISRVFLNSVKLTTGINQHQPHTEHPRKSHQLHSSRRSMSNTACEWQLWMYSLAILCDHAKSLTTLLKYQKQKEWWNSLLWLFGWWPECPRNLTSTLNFISLSCPMQSFV